MTLTATMGVLVRKPYEKKNRHGDTMGNRGRDDAPSSLGTLRPAEPLHTGEGKEGGGSVLWACDFRAIRELHPLVTRHLSGGHLS